MLKICYAKQTELACNFYKSHLAFWLRFTEIIKNVGYDCLQESSISENMCKATNVVEKVPKTKLKIAAQIK